MPNVFTLLSFLQIISTSILEVLYFFICCLYMKIKERIVMVCNDVKDNGSIDEIESYILNYLFIKDDDKSLVFKPENNESYLNYENKLLTIEQLRDRFDNNINKVITGFINPITKQNLNNLTNSLSCGISVINIPRIDKLRLFHCIEDDIFVNVYYLNSNIDKIRNSGKEIIITHNKDHYGDLNNYIISKIGNKVDYRIDNRYSIVVNVEDISKIKKLIGNDLDIFFKEYIKDRECREVLVTIDISDTTSSIKSNVKHDSTLPKELLDSLYNIYNISGSPYLKFKLIKINNCYKIIDIVGCDINKF